MMPALAALVFFAAIALAYRKGYSDSKLDHTLRIRQVLDDYDSLHHLAGDLGDLGPDDDVEESFDEVTDRFEVEGNLRWKVIDPDLGAPACDLQSTPTPSAQ